MNPALLLRWLPLISQTVDLFMHIRERRQARLAARRKAAKPCPPPVPTRARPIPKQNPRPDGKK